MSNVTTYPFTRERNVILGVLLSLAAAAWSALIWQARQLQDDAMMDDQMGLTMGMGAPLFIAVWVAMMVAIMFPTAAPMILTFARVQAGRASRGQVLVPTWLFVSAYIALWSATGVLAYGSAVMGEALADDSMWLMDNAGRIGGGVLILAGVYQISPLKKLCLGKCRSPINFILGSWRDGKAGAIQMGLRHAAYCLGCCWLLFVILFPLGMMNIAALAAVTVLIFAEKSLAIGARLANVAAVALIAYGALVLVVPDALPKMM